MIKSKKHKGSIFEAKYGPNLDIPCVAISLSRIELSTNNDQPHNPISIATDTDDNTNTKNIDYRQKFYNPTCGSRIYSPEFLQHKTNTVISRLSDVDANDTYFEGWMSFIDEQEIDDWIWSYSYQTHSCYRHLYSRTASNTPKPLYYPQYANDKDISNKKISHIKTIRYDCHKTKPRRQTEQQPLRTRKGDCKYCQCYICVKIYKVYTEVNHTTELHNTTTHNHIEPTYIAVISCNYPYCHTENTNWYNRLHAPLPRPLIDMINILASTNPNYKTFKRQIDNYMVYPHGLRHDIKQQLLIETSLHDPTVHVVDNNKLKYQFYKAIKQIRGLHKSDQDNIFQWISDLKKDTDRYDP